MTKEEAIQILIKHAQRCPEPFPKPHGYPEDYKDEYEEWKIRCYNKNEAIKVLTEQ